MMRVFVSCLVLLLASGIFAQEEESESRKAYRVLVENFPSQDLQTKAKVLRELGLLKEDVAVAFLAKTAADYSEDSETRREALKGLVAAIPPFGKFVEQNLRRPRIAVSPTLQAYREFNDPAFAEGVAMLLLSAKEGDLKEYLPTFLFLWDGESIPKSLTPENAAFLHKRLSFFTEFLSKARKKKLEKLLAKIETLVPSE